MKQYLDLMRRVLEEGTERDDRTGIGTRSLFGAQCRYDLSQGFPLLTTKKIHFRSVAIELLWFLRGDTNVQWLKDRGVSIWDEWADEEGNLGPIYGSQWRSWGQPTGEVVDQMQQLVDGLKSEPESRRHIVSAWNVGELDRMALPPCHLLIQFYVADGRLSCQMYQRSADLFLGVPFNIASYSLLTHMLAQAVGLQPGEFIHSLGDVHLYNTHLRQAKEQLQRKPALLPQLRLNPAVKSLFDFQFEDFELVNYAPLPHIAAPVAV